MRVFKDLKTFQDWSSIDKDLYTVSVIKALVMDGVRQANSGHIGGALSSSDFAYILFAEFLNINKKDLDWIARDRFVLSAGHESMLLYSMLYLKGILSLDDLRNFRQLNSRTPGHPEVETPGVEATTGPLGQGFGMAVGMALAETNLRATLKNYDESVEELVSHYTYVLATDGDLQEPITYGTAALAGHWQLGKLIVYYDSNKAQISGRTERCDSSDVGTVFEGLGWHVQKIDGHDHDDIRNAILTAQVIERPSLIVGNTIMAKGLFSMEGDHNTHGTPLPQDEIFSTKNDWGLPPADFYAPQEVVDHFNRKVGKTESNYQNWNNLLKQKAKKSTFKTLWDQLIHKKLPELDYPIFEVGTNLATRKAFGTVLESFAENIPNIIGGSADLEPSNYTGGFAKIFGEYNHANRQGRNLAFGVREFPMAVIMNGMALHGGLIPFGGTFLVFADYERPALRLAAIQKLQVIHELTHDSFYVGEDGPTHQPVEHIMSLRAIPDLNVYRPADARETAVCFKLALQSKNEPSALLLSRQGLPVLDLTYSKIEAGVRKGAYIVKNCDDPVEILIIATGSEVALGLEVAEKMPGKNIRVISMPSWELFEKQAPAYRRKLIPDRGCLKVSLEAGVTLGWQKYIGQNGITIGMDRFGLSAPSKDLKKEFGFTAAAVVKVINNYLAKLL